MKEITCEIIRDIHPLYVDEAVSRDTKELVEEHLFTCEALQGRGRNDEENHDSSCS